MTSAPKRWIAVVLSFLAAPLGMLYLGRPFAAFGYFLTLVAAGFADFWLSVKGFPALLTLVVAVLAAIHAHRLATGTPTFTTRPWFSRWYGLTAVAACIFVALALLRAFIFEPFRIPSGSMYPSLEPGSHIIVAKLGFGNYEAYGIRMARTPVTATLRRGDIFAFEYPKDRAVTYVMRLVGLPGDRVQYQAKRLLVNGAPVTQAGSTSRNRYEFLTEVQEGTTYRVALDPSASGQDFDHQVAAGHLFFLGDNRDHANDSRFWGQVPYDHVVGKVVYVIKP